MEDGTQGSKSCSGEGDLNASISTDDLVTPFNNPGLTAQLAFDDRVAELIQFMQKRAGTFKVIPVTRDTAATSFDTGIQHGRWLEACDMVRILESWSRGQDLNESVKQSASSEDNER